MNSTACVLVVDDEISMREMVAILLKRLGHDVVTARSGEHARSILDGEQSFDLVITDLLMDRGGGLDVIADVKQRDPGCEVIVITAFGSPETAVEAMKRGAFDYVSKPFSVDEFTLVIRKALERRALIQENRDLRNRVTGRYRFANIAGRSEAMRAVIDVCRKVADSPATVLVSGESGTGKEVIARAVHFSSGRAEHRFVPVNCGALPEQLMESELFGHVRGAFTGANEDKDGLIEVASGGTLFLDEIGELPPSLQVKLLRVLQDRLVRPVGAVGESEVDVRVIAATNQDLPRLVESGGFRKDLFYRLNVISVSIPPLRERREDIPLLVEMLLERLAVEKGYRVFTVSAEAMRNLLEYSYPGNVRELSNILERAATLASGEQIRATDLPPDLVHGRRGEVVGSLPSLEAIENLDAALSSYERDLIEQAFSRAEGARSEAARLLGISLRSLRYRMKKLRVGDGGT